MKVKANDNKAPIAVVFLSFEAKNVAIERRADAVIDIPTFFVNEF